tara:strand:+ start:108 stop:587 length:480 start_codon:yes stop_codon:yes gene_type:complete
MILPLFGGAIIDKMGVRWSITFFFILNLVGNFVFALGGVYENFTLMLIGRGIFGTGNFTSMTALTVIATKWFISSNLNLAYGLLSVSWGLSAMMSAIFTPILYGSEKEPHLGNALLPGFWLNLLCIAFLIPVLVIDYLADKEIKELQEDQLESIADILV